ncbi:hypothetical protein [Butyrivibrio sp. LB2008]|uniref:hypothetical protein n=1 Tax=Butyrivibrio sp. LB2008 TaxID=1408305 RepID=UPI00047E46DF|nr:hypothetical protein [Butyrivibrio sp. LB2008]
MKKKTTTAILLATTMMLALMGCGAASTDTDSSSDAASVSEVNAASDTNTSGDTTKETDADTSSDSASTESSISLTDGSFEYKGKTISILDDLETTLDTFNTLFPNDSQELASNAGSNLHVYGYDNDSNGQCNIDIISHLSGDKQLPGQIDILEPDYKTPEGISVGSSRANVIATYGEPSEHNGCEDDCTLYYKFDKCNLRFDLMNGKVLCIVLLHPDFPNQ